MTSSTVSERHHGPDVDSVDGGEHVLTGLRPSAAAAHAPVFDVPDGESLGDKRPRKRPPKLQPVALVPKTTVNDDNSTLSRARGKLELAELTGVITVSNPLHTQNLREGQE